MLIAAALAMTSMKQLKYGGLVGPGELTIAIVFLFQLLTNRAQSLSPSFRLGLMLILCIASIFTVSSIINWASTGSFPATSITDGAAVWGCLLLTAAILAMTRNTEQLVRILAWSAVLVVLPSAFLLVLAKFGVTTIGSAELMYDAIRFQGLSDDPNQLSRVCAVTPFLTIFLATGPVRPRTKVILLTAAAASVVVGIATVSQSAWASWIIGSLVYITWGALQRVRLGGVAAVAIVLISAATAGIGLFIAREALADSGEFRYFLESGGAARLQIAQLSWQTINESPASVTIGHGFGFHVLWFTPLSQFAEMESHDLFLDVLVRGGLIGLIPLLILVFRAMSRSMSGTPYAVALLAATLTFSLSVTPIRQPLFWLSMIACLGTAWRAPSRHTPDRRLATVRLRRHGRVPIRG